MIYVFNAAYIIKSSAYLIKLLTQNFDSMIKSERGVESPVSYEREDNTSPDSLSLH